MKFVEVVVDHDALNRELYSFIYMDNSHALRLSMYKQESKPSTRHRNWRMVNQWIRHSPRHSMPVRPTVPSEVSAKAVENFMNTLVVDDL